MTDKALAKSEAQRDLQLIKLNQFDPAKYNTLQPASIGDLSEDYSQRHFIVQLDVRPNMGDFYPESGKLALTKRALDTLGDAAGVIWYAPGCKRLDNMQQPGYCSFQAVGGIRRPDGTISWVTATKEIDLEALKLAGKSEKELNQIRVHKVALCETKARLRVLRALLHIKSTYTEEEARKPFVVTQVYLDPTKSEAARAALRVRVMRDISELFGDAALEGPKPVPALEAPKGATVLDDDDDEPAPSFDVSAQAAKEAEEAGDIPSKLVAADPSDPDLEANIADMRRKVEELRKLKMISAKQIEDWCRKEENLGCSYADARLDGLIALQATLAKLPDKIARGVIS